MSESFNFILSNSSIEKIKLFDGRPECNWKFDEIKYLAEQLVVASGKGPRNFAVAILARRGSNYLATVLACWYAGAYAIPLNSAWPAEKNQSILDRTKPHVVVVDNSTCDMCEGHKSINLETLRDQIRKAPIPAPGFEMRPLLPSDIAYIIFTSGSTGEPKGVVISALSYRSYIDWTRRNFDALSFCQTLLVTAELTFDITMGDLAFSLAFGTKVGVAPDNSNIPGILGMIMKHQVDLLYAVPTTHLAVTEFAEKKRGADLTSLKLVMSGGDVFPWSLVKAYQRVSPSAQFHNVYGPTEVTINCFSVRLDQIANTIEPDQAVPIGHAFDNIDFRLLHDDGTEAADGEIGELCVTGPQMLMGYFGDPELSASALVPDPKLRMASRSLYKTGDLAYVGENGLTYLRGRKDSLVKVKGYRIHPDEVGNAITAIPWVLDGVVVAVGSDNSVSLVAVVKLMPGDDKTEKDLISEIETTLPIYMLPSRVEFVSGFPLNQSGKIDKQALRESFA